MVSGSLGVALPCASAKRSRLVLDVVDDCSHVGRRFCRRDGAIIREMNDSFFTLNFLENGGIGLNITCETPYLPLIWHHQHFTVFGRDL